MNNSPIKRLSYRHLIICLMLVLTQTLAMVASAHTRAYEDFLRQFEGFIPINVAEYDRLVEAYSEELIPLQVEKVDHSDERIVRFWLNQESSVYLSASAESAPVTFVHPLLASLENGQRYLLPLIRSSNPGRRIPNTINLGRFSAGEHVVYLSQDQSSLLPIPDSLQITAARPNASSLLTTFIDSNPVIKIKNVNNVLDDIPLIGYSSLYQNGTRYLVKPQVIFSSENGGLIPPLLMSSFQRTVDVEWVMKQVFEADGRESASYQMFQSRDHVEKEFVGEVLFGRSPVLRASTPNNNFDDNRLRLLNWDVPNIFAHKEGNPIYYRAKPVFLPPGEWSESVLTRIPELQEWSQFEVAFESCVDLSNSSSQAVVEFKYDLEIVRQYLRISYPDRGCQDHKLMPNSLWVTYPNQRLGDS